MFCRKKKNNRDSLNEIKGRVDEEKGNGQKCFDVMEKKIKDKENWYIKKRLMQMW